MDHYPGIGHTDPQGYAAGLAPAGEPHRGYSAAQYETYTTRFLGGNKDHGFEARGQYHGGRVYDTGSHYC